VVIVVFAIFFKHVNGCINGYWLAFFAPGYSFSWAVTFRIGIGLVVFISGFVINQYHDKLLIDLRKSSANGYKIPYGGLFKYVSCPNFLGEIIEWGGFAILVWSLPGLSFFIWTFVNLVPRALAHHKWYKSHFDQYPEKRKAVLPFIM
jgi:3-oxo-5-alpha-steroid 4-dehydrogenase 1